MPAFENGSHSEASKIAHFIGLPKWETIDDLALVELVRKGFPAKTATTIALRVDPQGRFFQPTDIIPKATLHRRVKTHNRLLTKDESEKILSLSKLFAEVIRLYHNDLNRAAQFLLAPHPMLGDRAPIDLAKESISGTELVLKILARADAGVAA